MLFDRLCLACRKLESVRHCQWGKEIWWEHHVLFVIQTATLYTKNSERLCVNLMTVLWIRKELDDSNCDHKHTSAQQIHFNHPDKKRTHKYVGEIRTLFDKDSSKSKRSITRDFLSYLSVTMCMMTFGISYTKMDKSLLLSETRKDLKKNSSVNLLDKLKHFLKRFF